MRGRARTRMTAGSGPRSVTLTARLRAFYCLSEICGECRHEKGSLRRARFPPPQVHQKTTYGELQ